MSSSFSTLSTPSSVSADGAVLLVDGVIAGGVLLARLLAFDHFAAHQLAE